MYKPLFSPRRRLQTRAELVTLAGGKGRREWVVARGLCHYRLFDLRELPPARREESLALKVRQWCPFAECASYVVWHNGHAQVWVWDRARQQEAAAQAEFQPAWSVPEPLLRPRHAGDGIQVLRCAEGVEAQIWRGGVLHASHWWPDAPGAQAWGHFLRAHGLPPDAALPSLVATPFLPRPWGKSRNPRNAFNLRHEKLWVLLGAALLLSVATWEGVGAWKWHRALQNLQGRIDELSGQVGPILDARNRAVADRQAAEALLALRRDPSQLHLLALVAEKLPDPESRLLEWNYRTGELNFTVRTARLDPRLYVEAFQTEPGFQEVKTETGAQPDQLKISLRLVSAASGGPVAAPQ